MDQIEPPRRGPGRPPGSKNRVKRVKPAPNPIPVHPTPIPPRPTVVRSKRRGVRPVPFPIPPRPAELDDDLVQIYWRVAEGHGTGWYAKSRRRTLLTALVQCAAQHIPPGEEIVTKSVRGILAGWGCPADSQIIIAPFVQSALEDTPQTQVTLDIDVPGRRQILRAAELIPVVLPSDGWALPQPELRAALSAAALAVVLHESGISTFLRRDLKSVVDYECRIAGVPPNLIPSTSTQILVRAPVKISRNPTRVEGDRAKNINKLVKYAERELKRWEAVV